jgi:hypothetical protein
MKEGMGCGSADYAHRRGEDEALEAFNSGMVNKFNILYIMSIKDVLFISNMRLLFEYLTALPPASSTMLRSSIRTSFARLNVNHATTCKFSTAKPPGFPYGVSSFQEIRSEKAFYIDKTDAIPLLEENKHTILLRPARWGKSLLWPTTTISTRRINTTLYSVVCTLQRIHQSSGIHSIS